MQAGGSVTPLATLTGTSIYLLRLTDARVIVQQSDRTGQGLVVSSIPKAGGPTTTLTSANASLVGTTVDSVYVSISTGGGQLIRDDGSVARPMSGAPVFEPLQHVDDYYLNGVARCVPDLESDTTCSNGAFVEEAVADGNVVTLGRVTHSTIYRFANFGGQASQDVVVTTKAVPTLITFYEASSKQRDLYVWIPGEPNSLRQVTFNVP